MAGCRSAASRRVSASSCAGASPATVPKLSESSLSRPGNLASRYGFRSFCVNDVPAAEAAQMPCLLTI